MSRGLSSSIFNLEARYPAQNAVAEALVAIFSPHPAQGVPTPQQPHPSDRQHHTDRRQSQRGLKPINLADLKPPSQRNRFTCSMDKSVDGFQS